ncbi:MAG: S1C family serine protease [Acidimicrobiales bacterium]
MAAVIGGLVGGLVGYLCARGAEQTIVERFYPASPGFARLPDIQTILGKVEPAVVSIEAQPEPGHAGETQAGTGMIITPRGEVLTNDHVVVGARSVSVTLFGQNTALPARVVGEDPAQDLALLSLAGQQGLPTVSFGDSANAEVGDSVLAIGNALSLSGGLTVTHGIVSSLGRAVQTTNEATGHRELLSGLIQTDAAINSGNSGGPLVDTAGQVIGMNTAVAESTRGNAPAQGIGFAIAVDTIKPLLALLRAGGTSR